MVRRGGAAADHHGHGGRRGRGGGENVTGFAPGDRVCFDSTVYCLQCAYCLKGQWNLCQNRQVVGVSEGTYRRHGAMAEYVSIPQWIAVHMPGNLSFAQAALAETVSIGVHAANRTPLCLNDTVVVVGAGAVGLVAMQAIRLKGAGRIIVTDLAEDRLALARDLGADAVRAAAPYSSACGRGRVGGERRHRGGGGAATIDLALAITRLGSALTLVGNVMPRVNRVGGW